MTSINVVEPFRINLEIIDITSIYTDKKSIDDKGVGLNSFQNQLKIKEWDNGEWIVVVHKVYLIKAFLFDENNQKITLTNNIEISNQIDMKYFDVLHKNQIGSEVIVKIKNG